MLRDMKTVILVSATLMLVNECHGMIIVDHCDLTVAGHNRAQIEMTTNCVEGVIYWLNPAFYEDSQDVTVRFRLPTGDIRKLELCLTEFWRWEVIDKIFDVTAGREEELPSEGDYCVLFKNGEVQLRLSASQGQTFFSSEEDERTSSPYKYTSAGYRISEKP